MNVKDKVHPQTVRFHKWFDDKSDEDAIHIETTDCINGSAFSPGRNMTLKKVATGVEEEDGTLSMWRARNSIKFGDKSYEIRYTELIGHDGKVTRNMVLYDELFNDMK